MSDDRITTLEQAAVALLSEAKMAGVDIARLAEKAKIGIAGNAPYTWVGAIHKSEVANAIDYLLQGVKTDA